MRLEGNAEALAEQAARFEGDRAALVQAAQELERERDSLACHLTEQPHKSALEELRGERSVGWERDEARDGTPAMEGASADPALTVDAAAKTDDECAATEPAWVVGGEGDGERAAGMEQVSDKSPQRSLARSIFVPCL